MDLQIHASLVEVHRVGVLVQGESGVGKSECALELVQRGHKLVADDVVRLELGQTDASEPVVIGRSPELIRHYMELRGVGLLQIEELYGADAVLDHVQLDLICRLEAWQEGVEYERIGLDRPQEEVLGVLVPVLTLPVRPARSMATLIEVATLDFQSRRRGVNAARRLDDRLKSRSADMGRAAQGGNS